MLNQGISNHDPCLPFRAESYCSAIYSASVSVKSDDFGNKNADLNAPTPIPKRTLSATLQDLREFTHSASETQRAIAVEETNSLCGGEIVRSLGKELMSIAMELQEKNGKHQTSSFLSDLRWKWN